LKQSFVVEQSHDSDYSRTSVLAAPASDGLLIACSAALVGSVIVGTQRRVRANNRGWRPAVRPRHAPHSLTGPAKYCDDMNNELLSALRYKSEGPDVDFKSAQYRFVRGSEEEKAEMLKDILAMANSWRDGPGYIVLGFKDQRPHPAEVVGISAHIDDAAVQQFVHGKVKPKLTFRYEEHVHEGKTVGIISIPKQKRPFYLAHSFGKLKSNVVYVRRGSSTDEAEPPEVAAMVSGDTGRGQLRVDLSVLTANNEELPETVALRFLRFGGKLPDYETPWQATGPFDFKVTSIWHDNRDFWREAAKYAWVQSALIEVQFVMNNRSNVQLSNAKLEVSVEPLDGQQVQMRAGADLPEQPKQQWSHIHGMTPLQDMLDRREVRLVVDEGGATPICHVRFGSLLPGEQGRSADTLALIPLGPGKLRLAFRVLAGELATPIESDRIIEATGTVETLDYEGFKSFLSGATRR